MKLLSIREEYDMVTFKDMIEVLIDIDRQDVVEALGGLYDRPDRYPRLKKAVDEDKESERYYSLINRNITWNATPQGWNFWSDICKRLDCYQRGEG